MGTSHNGERSNMVFTDVTTTNGLDGSLHNQQQSRKEYHHKKKHKKKRASEAESNGLSMGNDDSDIITPYQNGHYLQPPPNGYYRSDSRLTKSVSNEDDMEIDEPNLFAQGKSTSYADFLSPQPATIHNMLLDDRGVHSSLSSVNNAITVAPSRNNLNDLNVFAGGRPSNLKRANHRNNRHQKHKGRSRTPDFASSRLPQAQDSQSILNRIDLSIRKNFGDWDDEADGKKLLNVSNAPKQSNKTPYFIPKSVASESDVIGLNGSSDVNLPRLFKSYDSVVNSNKPVIPDKSYKMGMSRDNADPNSILSQAKKTLSYVSGPCQS